DGRKRLQIRPVSVTPSTLPIADGSCDVVFGDTEVHCSVRLMQYVEGAYVTVTVTDQLAGRERGRGGGSTPAARKRLFLADLIRQSLSLSLSLS
ncbi:hypothetical protein KIPB_013418, partial [Kipferlia bialata]